MLWENTNINNNKNIITEFWPQRILYIHLTTNKDISDLPSINITKNIVDGTPKNYSANYNLKKISYNKSYIIPTYKNWVILEKWKTDIIIDILPKIEKENDLEKYDIITIIASKDITNIWCAAYTDRNWTINNKKYNIGISWLWWVGDKENLWCLDRWTLLHETLHTFWLSHAYKVSCNVNLNNGIPENFSDINKQKCITSYWLSYDLMWWKRWNLQWAWKEKLNWLKKSNILEVNKNQTVLLNWLEKKSNWIQLIKIPLWKAFSDHESFYYIDYFPEEVPDIMLNEHKFKDDFLQNLVKWDVVTIHTNIDKDLYMFNEVYDTDWKYDSEWNFLWGSSKNRKNTMILKEGESFYDIFRWIKIDRLQNKDNKAQLMIKRE